MKPNRPSTITRHFIRLALAGLACAAAFPSAHAQSTWDKNIGGNFSDATKWNPAGVPAPGSDLIFLNANPLGFTATNDLAGPFAIHSLTLDALYGAQAAAQFLTVAGNQLALSGAGAAIVQAGDASVTVTTPLSLGGAVSIAGAGQGALFLNGAITGSGPLTVARTGAGHTVLGAANGFTGGVVLQSGVLSLNDPASLGTGALTVNGGSVRMNQFIGPSGLSVANNVTANSTFTFAGNNSGIFTGVISGAGGVTNASAVGITLRLQGANTYTGATLAAISPSTSSGTTISLEAGGSALGSSGFTVGSFNNLHLDNSATNVTNRIADGAPVTLQRGTLAFTGNAGAASSETIGTLTGAGFATVSATAGPGQSAQLTAASLARTERGVFYFRGTALGQNAPGSANTASVLFTATPAGDLIGGAGAPGSTTQKILPYAVGKATASGNADTFVTYDGNGVRALTTAEFASAITDGTVSQDNARLASGTTTLTTGATLNSLVLAGGTVGGAGALTLTSGAVLVASGTPTIAAPLNLGAAEGVITTQGNTIISAPIAGSNGLTKAGGSTLTLSATPTYTGLTTVTGGALVVDSDARLGATSGVTLSGGRFNYIASTADTSARPFTMGAGNGNFDISNAAGAFTISSGIGGPGALVKQGSGTLTLAGTNTYTGHTTVSSGMLSVSSATNLGGGSYIALTSTGTLRTTAAFTLNKEVLLSGGGGSAIIETLADLTLNGPINHTGTPTNAFSLTKTGAAELILNGTNSQNGVFNLNAGTLRVNGLLPSANTTGNTLLVAASAGLGGEGLIERDTAFASGSFLTPGANATDTGLLTLEGTVTVGGNLIYNWQLDSGGFDLLDVNGSVAFNGGVFTVAFDDLDAAQPTSNYTIFSADLFTGPLPAFALDFTNAPSWAGLGLSVARVGNEIQVQVVPEPGTAIFGLAAGLALLLRRRRESALAHKP